MTTEIFNRKLESVLFYSVNFEHFYLDWGKEILMKQSYSYFHLMAVLQSNIH